MNNCELEIVRTSAMRPHKLAPQIKKIKEPKDLPEKEENYHLDLSSGGIYTKEELVSWRKHLELGDLHNAISSSIAHGVCIGTQRCIPTAEQPGYTLAALELLPDLQLSLWSTIDGYVKDYGTYISILVLIIETVRIISFIIMFSTTLATDGILAAKALVYLVFCSTHQKTKKIERRRKRQRLEESHADYVKMKIHSESVSHLGPDL